MSNEQSFEMIEVIIEIPRGSRNKYEVDHDTGAVWYDRHLYGTTVYPTEYGYVPHTLAEDGDPLDVLVLVEHPTFPGCHMHVRPVAVLEMSDDAGRDVKVLCVPAGDHRWDHMQDVDDVPQHLLDEIQHFFKVYKDLEPGKSTDVGEWSGVDMAREAYDKAVAAYAG